MNKLIVIISLLVILVLGFYFVNFYLYLGYPFSKSPDEWGQFGDYLGGVLNPILGFFSIILILKTIKLQQDANIELKEQFRKAGKQEAFKVFEQSFFYSVNILNVKFERFNIRKSANSGSVQVILIEDAIQGLRNNGRSNEDISKFILEIDKELMIYDLCRMFSNIVRVIDDQISDVKGFSAENRRKQYSNLIRFVDFSLLRLICISLNFLHYPHVEYLKGHSEFLKSIKDSGLGYEGY